ncbi:unnamed protein product, partial [marine sediment metagenome]
IISRPTVDLYEIENIAEAIEQEIDNISNFFRIEKNPELIVDGTKPLVEHGENIKQGIYNLPDNFFGVTEKELSEIFLSANLIIYYGHFFLEEDSRSSFFAVSPHPDDIKARIENFKEEWNKKIALPVPEIYSIYEIDSDQPDISRKLNEMKDLAVESTTSRIEIDSIRPNIKGKHFLLGACASAGIPLKSQERDKFTEHYPQRSVAASFLEGGCNTFIGTLFPVYASETGKFIKEFFREAFIEKVTLA